MTKKSQDRLARDAANAPIVEGHATRKEFLYTKNGVTLRFTLRLDIDTELKAFKELMEKAIVDIDTELDKHVANN